MARVSARAGPTSPDAETQQFDQVFVLCWRPAPSKVNLGPRETTLNTKSPPVSTTRGICRFAPSTTGEAHPGTLLAALLCWLDARASGDRVLLRLENLDPERSNPDFEQSIERDLAWLGLDWDETVVQSERRAAYDAALDSLAEAGLLYPCACSRAEIRASGVRTPDGGYRYDNRCRQRELPARAEGGWRASADPLRLKLPEGSFTAVDLGGLDLTQDPTAAFGDPVVLRRDGAVAYPLACVVDDAASGVTRVVRGCDIAHSTATQVAIQVLLGLPTPSYRHHLLLLERRGTKLAKLHGSVGARELRQFYSASELCGVLAFAAGLTSHVEATTPARLLDTFTWDDVARKDRVADWTGSALEISDCGPLGLQSRES